MTIFINGLRVKEITMTGTGAIAPTQNYVGLWCHRLTHFQGKDFKWCKVSFDTLFVFYCPSQISFERLFVFLKCSIRGYYGRDYFFSLYSFHFTNLFLRIKRKLSELCFNLHTDSECFKIFSKMETLDQLCQDL